MLQAHSNNTKTKLVPRARTQVHHALLRHTSSGNFENPQDTAETLLADPHALAEFSQTHWGEIVETRRRALLMLSASYWNNFEKGFTNSSVIGILMDAADTAMDRQRRAPKYVVHGTFNRVSISHYHEYHYDY